MHPARFPARPVCDEPEHVRRLAVLCRAETKPGCGPIPLRLLLAAQPVLLTPVLQVVHRVITRHLLEQTGFKADEGLPFENPIPPTCLVTNKLSLRDL